MANRTGINTDPAKHGENSQIFLLISHLPYFKFYIGLDLNSSTWLRGNANHSPPGSCFVGAWSLIYRALAPPLPLLRRGGTKFVCTAPSCLLNCSVCVYVWFRLLWLIGLRQSPTYTDAGHTSSGLVAPEFGRGCQSNNGRGFGFLIVLGWWMRWKERNQRVVSRSKMH